MRISLTRRAALLTALSLPLAACGGSDPAPATDDGASDGGADAGALTTTDMWIKAAEEGMTAGFGVITNGTDQDLVLVGARTDAASEVQLHETAEDGSGGMSMKEVEGGLDLPAGGELLLEPGGHNLMLMGIPEPLQPGDAVEITLEFEDGTELAFTADVKDFAGAQENYAPGEEPDGHNEHDGHDGHDEHEGHGASDGGDDS